MDITCLLYTSEDTDAELENKIKEDMQHQLVKVDENGEINDESYRVNAVSYTHLPRATVGACSM